MAARKTLFCSSRFWILLRPKNALILQERGFAKTASVSLCPRTSIARNLCTMNAVSKVESSKSELCTSSSLAEFKSNSYRIRKLCEDQKLQEASDLLDNLLASFGDASANFTSAFNCVLHHAVKDNDNNLVEYILSNMTKHNIKRDSATNYIITMYFSQRGLLDEGIKALKDMQADKIRSTPRNYQPLINLAARTGKLETMFSLFEEMKAKHSTCHQFDSVVIQGVLDSNESEKWRGKVIEILQSMKADRVKLSRETAEMVEKWFVCQHEENWQISWSSVNSR